jgi:uncharacterized linocin/CFP29 family protein
MSAKKNNFELFIGIDLKIGTNSHNKKYLRDRNLLKFFIGTKI